MWLEGVAQGDVDSCPRRKIWPLCPKSFIESVKSICLSLSMSLLILWLGESEKRNDQMRVVVVVSHQKYPSPGGWKRNKMWRKKKKKKCMPLLWELRRTRQGLVLFYWHLRMPLISNHNFKLSWSGFIFSSKPLDWFLPARSKFQTP